LGERILAEWEPASGRADNLTRWMAHYLAETLEAAKTETDPTRRNRLRRECADLILTIWKHREHWPRGQPFRALGALVKELSTEPSPFDLHADPHDWGTLIKELDSLHQREKRWLLEAAAANEADRTTSEWEKVATEFFSNTEGQMARLRKKLFGENTATSLKVEDTPAKKHRRLMKALRKLRADRSRLHAVISERWFGAAPLVPLKPKLPRRRPRRG